MKTYLAIDIGASSGRHILGYYDGGRLQLEEIYRFENALTEVDGHLTWNTEELTEQVIRGLAACKAAGKIPETVAIDTWGVDYVLLDGEKREIAPTYAYRDGRTDGVPEQVDAILPREALFARTGIQPLAFNTVYQLFCDKQSGKLQKAKYFLMMPDYLSFRLTGRIANEYTNATTGALVQAETRTWDVGLLDLLGIPKTLFSPLCLPGTALGRFSDEVRERVGFDATVVHAPSHDTAAAVAACPIGENGAYLSSGTWSLIGTENEKPLLQKEILASGFTNEGGVEYRYRFLENIMGMWLFQNIRRNLDKKYTYDEMMELAKASTYTRQIDPNDKAFVAPENMVEAIRTALGDPDLPIGDVLKSVYLSLAHSYDTAIRTIERYSGKRIDSILIVGGGSKDAYLNELTARVTGKKVLTGLSEATATGNLLSQIRYTENLSLAQTREIVKQSFSVKEIG